PDGNYLAVNYLIPDTDGPPFGTTREEQMQRFAPHFELLAEWVPRSYPNRTGLELMLWWKRRAREGLGLVLEPGPPKSAASPLLVEGLSSRCSVNPRAFRRRHECGWRGIPVPIGRSRASAHAGSAWRPRHNVPGQNGTEQRRRARDSTIPGSRG